MGLVIGKDSSRIMESWEIGRTSKPNKTPMASKSDTQDSSAHADNVCAEAKVEPKRTSTAENDADNISSPVIERDSYGAMMKARLDHDLKRFLEQKANSDE